MRFALSAMAATSGLLLLGLAFYGQPALYMQQVREEFDRLVAGPPVDQPDAAQPADADAVNDRMAALQQQVARLRDELAAKQNLEPPPVPPSRPKPESQAEPGVSEHAAIVTPLPLAIASAPVSSAPINAAPVSAAPPVALASQFSLPPVAPAPTVQSSDAAGGQGEVAKQDWLAPSNSGTPALPGPSTAIVQQRRDIAIAEPPLPPAVPPPLPRPEQPKADTFKAKTIRLESGRVDSAKLDSGKLEPFKVEPPKPEPAKPEPAKPEPAKPEPARLAPPKPVAAKPPSPVSLPSSPRQDVDDTQSVLARLRQTGPTVLAQSDAPGVTESRQTEPRMSVAPPPPSLPKLNSARAALAAGRIDDARRLLQEAQLQLVFRPVNVAGDEQPLAGKSAADVAHALEALSANNIPLSRRYIDVAAADLSGTGTNLSPQAPDLRPTGYAPAYPPR